MIGRKIGNGSPSKARVSSPGRLVELSIACIMLLSGFQHMANPFAFLRAIDNYQLVDINLSYYAAAVLPMLQIALALLLVFGSVREGSLIVSASLFLIFLGAQLSAKFRGLDIECGCFGPSGSKITWWSIGLVAALAVVAGYLAFRSWQSCRSLVGQRTV